MAVLAMTAALFNVSVFGFRHFTRDGFMISHPRIANIRLNLELAQHPVHQDIQMELAHPADDRLARILIDPHFKGRIFFSQFSVERCPSYPDRLWFLAQSPRKLPGPGN